ncbi:DUF1801 domain-containing protein [Runella aurantiaca]|uniref:DUF1801 domain-containing protein n=1 Tax=Runella aurantiaca TaxID=2282308 RepID=A0A369I7R6_9BACT|nr:DUF1801 domain-containing protein [Runella aurantiaca]RDB03194.1 DUF1801 domain-containing protein [Runella aurantiaca]
MPKSTTPPKTDAEKVGEYMHLLEHPLKAEINALRAIIMATHPALSERIKWNAPSYYAGVDLVTFNLRMTHKVHLVFHHAAIVNISSALLEGDYKDRRMMYFNNMAEVETHRAELQRIMVELVTAAAA